MNRLRLSLVTPILLAAAVVAAPAAIAQQSSQGYKFLEAVEKEDGKTVTDMLDTPGSTLVNSRQVTSGNGALHILTSHPNSLFFQFLLQRGADANMRDGKGNTPLVLATMAGREDLAQLLLTYKANPNLGNAGGQTPLILAVTNRDVALTAAAAGQWRRSRSDRQSGRHVGARLRQARRTQPGPDQDAGRRAQGQETRGGRRAAALTRASRSATAARRDRPAP